MIDLLWLIVLALIAWELHLIGRYLGGTVTPVARNEEATEDGTNEPEPRRGR